MGRREIRTSESFDQFKEEQDWKQKYWELSANYNNLKQNYEQALKLLQDSNQLTAIAPLSGILNLRSVQSNEQITGLLEQLIIRRLTVLLGTEGRS